MNGDDVFIRAVDRVEIVTLMDNYVDVLLESSEVVTRPPVTNNREISTNTLQAEHGLSLLVTVHEGEENHSVLLDTGYSRIGVPRNLEWLEIDPKWIETVVLSHGHMDHTGSLYDIFDCLDRPVPIVVHPEAFHAPRYLDMDGGQKMFFPCTLKRDDMADRGIEIIESEGPLLIANDMILVSGEVERTTPFEKGMPNAFLERNGKEEKDLIRDDQCLVVHLKDKGLVVISGCAHTGIVNTILYAKKITGVEKIHTVIGGFHLSGRAFEPIIEKTIEALKELDLKVIVPMHCTGWKAINRMSEAFPLSFVLNSVGSRFNLC
ncbi:MAG: MBL fold metallo-hydrolase [Deltaproteobacteria bacterium]|nr:MBL fold metallo-hydrolase [Deltaproteobacteria bacterium]